MNDPAPAAHALQLKPEHTVLELVEYRPRELTRDRISAADGRLLWERFGSKVEVTFPNPASNDCWLLQSLGWVGYIPVSPELGFSLQPKTPLSNIFRMLEYAYRLKSFEILAGLYEAASLQDFYERLANIFALRILDRARQGLYRTYVADADTLPYLCGNLELAERLRRPWGIQLPCNFQEHTGDVEENRILLWALNCVLHSGLCSERVLPTVRRAFRTLRSSANLEPFTSADCADRHYNRLNTDYRPLHALARFLIEHAGPTSDLGDRSMLPYLVSMALLFEQFVAQWFQEHLPRHLEVRAQEICPVGGDLAFHIDMVLYERATDQPIAVLDTKYKVPQTPSLADISQVISYAVAKGCTDAILIYPTQLAQPLDTRVGGVRVRTLAFELGGDLEAGGLALLGNLGC